tara:strand:+ start:295 stop:660 length:366 start_codon:yes stop_codon:yes gene_type:complete
MDDITNKFPRTLQDVPVKMLKLVSGESIIAYVHDGDDDTISIEEPMRLHIEEDQQLVFSPYLPFSEQALHHLDMHNVMLESEVSTDIKGFYMKILLDQVEGIDTPSRPPAITTMKGNSSIH